MVGRAGACAGRNGAGAERNRRHHAREPARSPRGGGTGHDIADNRIALNRIGVYVDALYEGGRLTEILMPEIDDPEKVRRYGEMKDSAVHAHHHRIERNRVTGNEIAANAVHDNLAWGIALDSTSHDNRLTANVLAGNRVGLKREGAKDNVVRANSVDDNTAYGIDVDVPDGVVPFAPASSGNLFVLNDLRGNAVNARDTSDHVFGEAEFLAALDDYPFPKELREMMAVMPQVRARMAAQMRASLQSGANR